MNDWNPTNVDGDVNGGGEEDRTNSLAPRTAWKPGQSGNPLGRPKGNRNKNTILRNELLRLVEESPGGMKAFLTKVFQEQPVEYLRLMVKLEPRERFVHHDSKRLVMVINQVAAPLPHVPSSGS